MTPPDAAPPASFAALSHWLALITGGLRQALAAHGGRTRAAALLAWTRLHRLHRLAARFDALVSRLAAGRPAAQRRQRTRPARSAPAASAGRLPTGRAWLVRLLPGEAACFAGQLQALLADPQTAALLATAPEAGRILRPLCRMLAIAPEGTLALPSAPRTPGLRTPGPTRTRTAKPASSAPPRAQPSAISQIWAALMASTPATSPGPSARKPPWPLPA